MRTRASCVPTAFRSLSFYLPHSLASIAVGNASPVDLAVFAAGRTRLATASLSIS
jgi:hypothetical protein